VPKKFSFTSALDHDVERVHATLTNEEFWKNRIAASPTGDAELEVRGSGPGTISLTMADSMGTSGLPSVVRGVLPGPLVIERADEWGPLDGGIAHGVLTGGARGLPITVSARSELRAGDTGGTVVEVHGEATVKVPLVGGKIEGLIVQLVESMVRNDSREIDTWLADS